MIFENRQLKVILCGMCSLVVSMNTWQMLHMAFSGVVCVMQIYFLASHKYFFT